MRRSIFVGCSSLLLMLSITTGSAAVVRSSSLSRRSKMASILLARRQEQPVTVSSRTKKEVNIKKTQHCSNTPIEIETNTSVNTSYNYRAGLYFLVNILEVCDLKLGLVHINTVWIFRHWRKIAPST